MKIGQSTPNLVFLGVKASPITPKPIQPRARLAVAVLALTLLSSLACASEYCTREQYERDHALIADAFSNGSLVKGPKGLRDSILVQEGEWYKMNYPQQIAFMQSFECSLGRGKKQFLYMDVRSLATGKLLATWTLGVLKPAEEPPNLTIPGTSGAMEDENRIGLTGEARAAFIKYAIDECNKVSNSSTVCSCCATAMADRLSIKELKEASANGARGMGALWPKLDRSQTRR